MVHLLMDARTLLRTVFANLQNKRKPYNLVKDHPSYIVIAFLCCFAVSSMTFAKPTVPPIVYSATYFKGPTASAWSPVHLYLINPDGTGKKQITSTAASDLAPRWSKNGRWIYFFRFPSRNTPDSKKELWVYDTTNGKEQRLNGKLQIEQDIARTSQYFDFKKIAEKLYPGKEFGICWSERFSDGEKVAILQVLEYKQAYFWSKRQPTGCSYILLIQNQQGKVEHNFPLKIQAHYIRSRVPATHDIIIGGHEEKVGSNDFLLLANSPTYIVDRNTGTCKPFGGDALVDGVSHDGKHYVGTGAAFYLCRKDSQGKRKLQPWNPRTNPKRVYPGDYVVAAPLLVGTTTQNNKPSRCIVSGYVRVVGCDWRGATKMHDYGMWSPYME